MVHKEYRKGAEDVAGIAAKAFDGMGKNLEDILKGFHGVNGKQHELNKGLLEVAEDHEQRLHNVEYRLPSIDFDLVDTMPAEQRALLGGMVRAVSLPNEACCRTADFIISRLGIEPLVSIENDQIALLPQEVQRVAAYYLYLLLRRTGGNVETEDSVNSILDEFAISNREKRQIKMAADEYSIAEIDDAIRIRKGGKQNIVIIGKSGAVSSALMNAVLGKTMVNDGFYHIAGTDPKALETNESPIRICGVFQVGYDLEENTCVLEAAREVVRKKSDTNRISHIWYCINTSTHRVEPFEILLLKELMFTFEHVNIIVVFTNCLSQKTAEALSKVIEQEIHGVQVRFVNVLTEEVTLDNGQTIRPYGTDDLISLTVSANGEESAL